MPTAASRERTRKIPVSGRRFLAMKVTMVSGMVMERQGSRLKKKGQQDQRVDQGQGAGHSPPNSKLLNGEIITEDQGEKTEHNREP